MAKYVAIFVSLIFFVISVNSAVLEPSADIIRSEDAEEGKYYQRVKDVKDKVDKEGEFEPTKDTLPIYPLQNQDNKPEQIEKQGKDLVDNTDDTETDVEKQTIVARDVNEPVEVNSSLTDAGTKVNNDETKNYVSTLDIDSYGPEEDLDGTYHDNIITNRNNDEITEKDDAQTDASQNEVNGENTNKLDEYKSYKSDIEIYDDIVNHFANKDYEVDFSENNELETPEESSNSETDFDTEHTTSSEETSESFENENIVQKTMEEQKSKPEALSNENDYAHAFPEVEDDADENDVEVEVHEDEPLHEMTDNENEFVKADGLQEETKENEEEIEQPSEDEEENETEDNEMKNEDIEDTVEEQKEDEEEKEEEKEEETEAESEVETEKSEDYEEEQQREYDNQIIENSEEENDNEVDHVEVQSNNEEMEDETEEEAERDEPGKDESEHEGQNMEELENDDEYDAETEDTNEVENIESENEDESEEENNEDERDIVGDVYPMNPPSIKEHNIIYAALKESSMFDKEEEEEDNEEEEENEVSDENLVFGEVEPPGSLDDIQMFPFQASKEQIQTNENDCSLPAETGPCRAYHKRFFYNSNTRECDVFVYGGCEGNANSFKTLDDCVNTCVKNSLNL